MASRTASGVAPEKIPGHPKHSAKSGQNYKIRSKEWLEKQGYEVLFLERMMWRFGKPGNCPRCGEACGHSDRFAMKADQAASDLQAMRANPPELIFVQSKLGDAAVLDARRKFLEHKFPAFAKRWILVWTKGARNPQVVDCTADTMATVPERRVRQRQPEERLF